MANMPHPSRKAVTWRLQRDLVEAVQRAAAERGETVLDFASRALAAEVAASRPGRGARTDLRKEPTAVEITDTAGTSGTTTVDIHNVAATITPWFPDADADTRQAIADLQGALILGRDYTAWAEYLGLLVTEA